MSLSFFIDRKIDLHSNSMILVLWNELSGHLQIDSVHFHLLFYEKQFDHLYIVNRNQRRDKKNRKEEIDLRSEVYMYCDNMWGSLNKSRTDLGPLEEGKNAENFAMSFKDPDTYKKMALLNINHPLYLIKRISKHILDGWNFYRFKYKDEQI